MIPRLLQIEEGGDQIEEGGDQIEEGFAALAEASECPSRVLWIQPLLPAFCGQAVSALPSSA